MDEPNHGQPDYEQLFDEVMAKEMAEEIAALRDDPLTIAMHPLSALRIAGVLQLALRHPGLNGDNRAVTQTMVESIRQYFKDANASAVLTALRRGDH